MLQDKFAKLTSQVREDTAPITSAISHETMMRQYQGVYKKEKFATKIVEFADSLLEMIG